MKEWKRWLNKEMLLSPNFLLVVWILIALVNGIIRYTPERCNNFLIFRQVFWHTIQGQPLYELYPEQYYDLNHYGAVFSWVIAPFAVLPSWLGGILWLVALTLLLYWAVRKLPMKQQVVSYIILFSTHELHHSLLMFQFNVAIAAIIILAFVLIDKEKDIWAAFFIVLGTMVKLYGIVGLAFFFFSKHKPKLLLACVGWAALFFVLPMLISSPEYILSQYVAWWDDLTVKNSGNAFAMWQNISVLGMIRKISGVADYSDAWIILSGLILFGLPYLRVKQYKHLAFRLTLLASVLLFTVLFSTGSERCSYIIAFLGIGIWYWAAPWKRSVVDVALMVAVFYFASLFTTDLFPRFLKKGYMIPYALQALPCTLVWLKLTYEMMTREYEEKL